jgi:hypothetical protein
MIKENKKLSRSHLANPHQGKSLHERLILDEAIDLRDNSKIVYLDDGYAQVVPIDASKLYK